MKNLIKREQSKPVCFAESENSRTKFKRLIVCLMAMMGVLTISAQSIYDFKVKDDVGQEVSLSDYKGKVLLIVNTATRCGFTPQYKELEALYEKYAKDGFEILDFPCNQFGEQAPGTIQEIHSFCTANFDIHFPQFDKIDVNGDNAHPLYTWLKAQAGGVISLLPLRASVSSLTFLLSTSMPITTTICSTCVWFVVPVIPRPHSSPVP